MTKQRVGLVGAGLMGHGIGKNLLAKGYPLAVLAHRNRVPVEDLVAKGAKEAASARELTEKSDVVILCVTGSPQVEEIVYAKDGVLAGIGSGKILIDCSTAEPGSTMKVAAAIAAKGGKFIDAPLTRTPKEAEEGRLGVMTGGDPAVIKEVYPILQSFGEAIVHAGGIGAAHTLKLVNNFLSLGTAAVVAEAIATAARAGVDMKALHDIVTAGGANSVMFERIMKVPLADDDSSARFAISNAAKDMRYYTNMAETLPITAFIAEAVHQTYVMALNRGYGDRFVPRLVNLLCEVNNIKLKKD
jgi:3-hydroxyisobutyrate dehydrogenase-like beta-hydroxyacid dehydrogenase